MEHLYGGLGREAAPVLDSRVCDVLSFSASVVASGVAEVLGVPPSCAEHSKPECTHTWIQVWELGRLSSRLRETVLFLLFCNMAEGQTILPFYRKRRS